MQHVTLVAVILAALVRPYRGLGRLAHLTLSDDTDLFAWALSLLISQFSLLYAMNALETC